MLHNAALQSDERRHVALLNCGPHAVLTAFTAAADLGLVGWERDEIHVLAPAGARVCRQPNIPVHMHYTADWAAARTMPARRLHQIAPALLLAASSFAKFRPACGILAAGVQQRLGPRIDSAPP